jgi:hypothetical protein
MPSFFPTLSFPLHPLIPLSSLYFFYSLYPLLAPYLLPISSLYFWSPLPTAGTLSAPSIIPLFWTLCTHCYHPVCSQYHPSILDSLYPLLSPCLLSVSSLYFGLSVPTADSLYLLPVSSLYFLDSLYPLLAPYLLPVSSLYFGLPVPSAGTLSAPSINPLFWTPCNNFWRPICSQYHPSILDSLYPLGTLNLLPVSSLYFGLSVPLLVSYLLPVSSLYLQLPPSFCCILTSPVYCILPPICSSLYPLLYPILSLYRPFVSSLCLQPIYCIFLSLYSPPMYPCPCISPLFPAPLILFLQPLLPIFCFLPPNVLSLYPLPLFSPVSSPLCIYCTVPYMHTPV